MTDTAVAKRAQRRRLAEVGLTTCSVLVPARLAETFRHLALVSAALHRTRSSVEVGRSVTDLVRITLPQVDLLDPALPEPTRRALAALRYDLGMTGSSEAGTDVTPAAKAPGRPRNRPDGGAEAAPTRRSQGVPEGWKVERSGKPPTAAQAALAGAIAWSCDLDIPPPALEDRKVASAWIALHVEKWKRGGSPKPPPDHVGPAFQVEGSHGAAASGGER